ncbi:hypothetical protein HK405_003421 [Cladochytrium tenue]|nr:hypothetical protein HK405_003421 [Cladochytrium tenue]
MPEHDDSYAAAAIADSIAAYDEPPSLEWSKMVAGELFRPLDPYIRTRSDVCKRLLYALNSAAPAATGAASYAARIPILSALFAQPSADAAADTIAPPYIEPPFHCDYGCNIALGSGVYMNFGCVVLDGCPVRIGARTMFGPGVHVYTAAHPLDPAERSSGVEFGRPVTIGDDVWVGGGAIILPGVTIGDAAVIGAGSVVTKNVEPYTVVAGNPARVVRSIPRQSAPAATKPEEST